MTRALYEAADDNTTAKMQLVVNGVRADPEEGEDSALYGALGYARTSERKTGLTRKRKDPSKTWKGRAERTGRGLSPPSPVG